MHCAKHLDALLYALRLPASLGNRRQFNSDTYSIANCNDNRDSDSDGNSHADSDGNSHADSNSHCYAESDTNVQLQQLQRLFSSIAVA